MTDKLKLQDNKISMLDELNQCRDNCYRLVTELEEAKASAMYQRECRISVQAERDALRAALETKTVVIKALEDTLSTKIDMLKVKDGQVNYLRGQVTKTVSERDALRAALLKAHSLILDYNEPEYQEFLDNYGYMMKGGDE
jgi:chromosome segregation ATPase